MARTDFRAAAARRLSEERELSPAIFSLLVAGADDAECRRPHRPARQDRAEPRAAAPRIQRGDPPGAVGVDPGARRPPADPRPAARRKPLPADRRGAALARLEARRRRFDPRPHRGHRRRHRARDRDHREPAARGHLAARRGRDVRPHGSRPRVQHPEARRQARQGQGLSREPVAPGRRPRRDPAAGVLAQRHAVPRLRVDEGRRPEEAQAARRPGCGGPADADQAAREDRGPPDPAAGPQYRGRLRAR